MASAADRSTSPPKLPLWRRRWLRRVLVAVGALTLLGLTAVGVAALWAFTILPRSLPSVTALETLQPIQGTKIYDDNDEPMTELHVERRILVPLAQIPQSLRDAILATEDRPRLDPTRAEADDRPVFRRLCSAVARGEVRPRPRPQGRTQRLHDAQSDHAAGRGAVAPGRAQSASGSLGAGPTRRVPGGRRDHGRAPDRLREGHGRRLRFLAQRVQPRRAGQAAARLRVQALHLHRRAGGRLHARLADRGFPGVLHGRRRPAGLEARELRS